jgi:hypothetical protein
MNSGEIKTVTLPARRRGWRPVLRWTIRVAVVLVVIGLLGWALLSFISSRMVQRDIAMIREAGEPVALHELLLPRPEVDEELDAGPFYSAALALARATSDEHYELMPQLWQTGQVTPELLEVLRIDMQRNAMALEMLDQAAEMPHSSFEFGLWYGIGHLMPQLNESRHLANVVSMRTVERALRGEGDAAVESLLQALPMLRLFEREPVLVVFLVQLGVYARFVEDARTIVSFSEPSPEALARLERAMHEAEASLDLRPTWLAERAFSMEMMRYAVGGLVHPRDRMLVGEPAAAVEIWPPMGRLMLVGQLRMYRRLIESPDEPWPQRLEMVREVLSQRSGWPMRVFEDVSAPSLMRSTETLVRGIATSRSMRAALLIEQFRREHGRLPETLDEVPAMAERGARTDPFTGDDLIYRRTDVRYVVYSVDINLSDDGGPPIDEGRSGDIGVHIRIRR